MLKSFLSVRELQAQSTDLFSVHAFRWSLRIEAAMEAGQTKGN